MDEGEKRRKISQFTLLTDETVVDKMQSKVKIKTAVAANGSVVARF